MKVQLGFPSPSSLRGLARTKSPLSRTRSTQLLASFLQRSLRCSLFVSMSSDGSSIFCFVSIECFAKTCRLTSETILGELPLPRELARRTNISIEFLQMICNTFLGKFLTFLSVVGPSSTTLPLFSTVRPFALTKTDGEHHQQWYSLHTSNALSSDSDEKVSRRRRKNPGQASIWSWLKGECPRIWQDELRTLDEWW